MESSFRNLPSVDRVLAEPRLSAAVERYSHKAVAEVTRQALQAGRKGVAAGSAAPSPSQVAEQVLSLLAVQLEATLRPVINATGVILHTNLGRSPLSQVAAAAARQAALGYDNLELDLQSGERGSRHVHLEELLRRVTGAESGLAVNNNAAAVTLALNTLARGLEVIVSRGEAVEIGGGFRIPEILKASGAKLVEVGTTNRTYLSDFESAISSETAAFLRVHPSNFRVSGFTATPTLEEMAAVAKKRNVLLLHDVGSGALLDTTQFGLAHEPMPQESLVAGADLVFFSGDKLLGGPQAGIIVGKATLVAQLKQHPLVRALRLDKMQVAALQATLLHYARGEAIATIPIWRMITATRESLDARAARWAGVLAHKAKVIDTESTIGGGSLPGETLPSRALAITGDGTTLERLAKLLRAGTVPVLGRIVDGHLLLDPRTVLPDEDEVLIAALKVALA